MADIDKFTSPRLPDWRVRLTEYLGQVSRRTFRPGVHDCALFAAGAVEAMTGIDPAASWRGSYRSIADGVKALRGAGFGDHLELVAALLEPVAPALARVGDIAVVPADDEGVMALGVVQGESVYVLQPGGLALLGRLSIQKAYRV